MKVKYEITLLLFVLVSAFYLLYIDYFLISILDIIVCFIFLSNKFKKYLIIIFLIIVVKNILFETTLNNAYSHTAVVLKTTSNSLLVKEDNNNYLLFGINDLYLPGDVITFDCSYIYSHEKSTFDIYLKSNNAAGYGYPTSLSVSLQKHNFRNNIFINLYNDESFYSDLMLILLYGYQRSSNIYIYETINKIGIYHLVVISGFHISILNIFIEKILAKFIKNKNLVNVLQISIVIYILYLIYFPLTGVRAFITSTLSKFTNIESIELISLTGIIMFLYNQYVMLSFSMILSFTIVYFISFNKNSSSLYISFIAFNLTLPILSSWNEGFNLLAPVMVVILTPFVMCMYLVGLLFIFLPGTWEFISLVLSLLYIPLKISSLMILHFHVNSLSYNVILLITLINILFCWELRNNKNNLILIYLIIDILLFVI